jgi:hypothetical protein
LLLLREHLPQVVPVPRLSFQQQLEQQQLPLLLPLCPSLLVCQPRWAQDAWLWKYHSCRGL